ncbi:MAG: hypothetical protein ACK41C_16295 [Phenylobacterium sp.]|uniref:hypothetical protein n=1 Tax=Phenylobacterium sp. TaxID=1871053 RepID=UPI00391992E3
MTAKTETETMSFRRAFEAEHARRDAERRAREEAERKQQEEDLARAEALHRALAEDAAFFAERGITLDLRRYTVSLNHQDFLIDAYFEGGRANVRSADRRTATTPTAAPRKSQMVDTVEDALMVMAQYLADEIR